jgi:membrane protein
MSSTRRDSTAQPQRPTPPGGRPTPADPTDIGRRGLSATLRRVRHEFKHDAIPDRAAALTYFGVLAIFPALLVVVSLLGLLGQGTTDKVLANVESLAPGSVKSFITTAIEQTQNRPGTAGFAAVVGVVLAVWSASGYIAAFMRTTNQIYGVEEGRPIWKTAPIRLAITVTVMVLLIVTVLMVVVTGSIASQVGKALGVGHGAVVVWDIAKWPVLLVIVSLMLSLLYWAAPNVKQPGFRWYSPGGAIAVVIWLIVSGAFGLYVSLAGSYNKTYGSLASIIIFLVWLWITNIAVLLGAEVNAELEHQRAVEAGLPEDVEPFVELRDTRKLDDDERRRMEHAATDRRTNGA